MLDLWLPCVPPRTTHQRKKIVTIKLRDGRQFSKLADKPELTNAREFYVALLRPHMPDAPIEPPISLTLEFTWPWRASDSKRYREHFERIPSVVKPDCSNAAKTLEDILAGLGFIPGDEKVAELVVRKFIGARPGVSIRIATIPPTIVQVTLEQMMEAQAR